eukprot:scaffold44128_cov75-Cyclotella_meneghiniana.AAC.5
MSRTSSSSFHQFLLRARLWQSSRHHSRQRSLHDGWTGRGHGIRQGPRKDHRPAHHLGLLATTNHGIDTGTTL